MRRFRVGALPSQAGEAVSLSREASHHLLVVCRHPRGGRVVLFDGEGRQALAELVTIDDGHAVLHLLEAPSLAAPSAELHLLLGIPKGPALDHALRMAVEVGATHVHLALADRSVPRSDRHERWQRILASACQQCGRADQPTLERLGPLDEVMLQVPDTLHRFVAIPGAPAPAPVSDGRAIAIGPEGGFHPKEISRLVQHGWSPVALGPWTLRTDTAVAVGLAMLARM